MLNERPSREDDHDLDAGLTPHLDEEEQEILPIAAGCINVAEWG